MRAWDGIMFFWIVFWLVVGGWTGYQIWQLTGLSSSTVDSGRALQSAGQALQHLGDTPLIGEQTGQIGDRVVTTASGIVTAGERADSSIRGLSVLIGLAIGLAPTGPVLLFYLPMRAAHRRDVVAIRRVVADGSGQEALQLHLAHQALSSMSYAQVHAVVDDRSGDTSASSGGEALAEAELVRLGLEPPSRSRQ